MQDLSMYSSEDTTSPTAALESVMLVATIAAKENRSVYTLDIGGAYLNAHLTSHEVLMKLDPIVTAILLKLRVDYIPFVGPDGCLVMKLNKALYGLVESARLWYNHLSGFLIDDGFTTNPLDPCIFNKMVNGIQCTVCVYVDDLLMTCAKEQVLADLVSKLKQQYKELTVSTGTKHSYLGMTFDFAVSGKVHITMEKYIEDLLRLYKVTGKAATPAAEYLFDIRESSPLLSDAKRIEFHSCTAKLLYLCKRVRPDILLPVIFLTGRVRSPNEDDQAKLERVLKYLNSEPELGLTINPGSVLSITAYVDASFGVHPDYKSHTGSVIMMDKGAVFAKSSKQKLMSKSSTEAELIGLSDALSQIIWTRDFMIAQGHKVAPAVVMQDNRSTMAMVEKGRPTSERTRHVNIRYFFIKDKVESGEISIEYLPTESMIADILTKPLQGELFRRLRNALLNCRGMSA
jgi:hypothetical protein